MTTPLGDRPADPAERGGLDPAEVIFAEHPAHDRRVVHGRAGFLTPQLTRGHPRRPDVTQANAPAPGGTPAGMPGAAPPLDEPPRDARPGRAGRRRPAPEPAEAARAPPDPAPGRRGPPASGARWMLWLTRLRLSTRSRARATSSDRSGPRPAPAGPAPARLLVPGVSAKAAASPERLRRHDRPAVPALDLAQPLDQVHAGAPRAPVQVGRPVHRVLASRTDENLAVPPHPALPRALPAAGVGLPHTTSIAGHPRLLRSSPVAGSPPAGRGQPRQLRSASTFVYSAMSRAWGMGFTTFHRMTPALSMMNVPRVATPLSSSNTP